MGTSTKEKVYAEHFQWRMEQGNFFRIKIHFVLNCLLSIWQKQRKGNEKALDCILVKTSRITILLMSFANCHCLHVCAGCAQVTIQHHF